MFAELEIGDRSKRDLDAENLNLHHEKMSCRTTFHGPSPQTMVQPTVRRSWSWVEVFWVFCGPHSTDHGPTYSRGFLGTMVPPTVKIMPTQRVVRGCPTRRNADPQDQDAPHAPEVHPLQGNVTKAKFRNIIQTLTRFVAKQDVQL
ncbi:hypothetical protein MTR67_002334 [Solanum verrucosum]|uniref:Uncharacterized protein n=1 Tax=Solanum verrucosum TaxID=315347 RepID=A0AAF0T8N8_SOLVR|nr:hypothetical protein MTR67_002334 [Solanum verrucosum]